LTPLTGRKAAAVLTAVVALTLAASVYVAWDAGRRGPGDGDEQERKRAFEAAMRRGNLSLYDAQYWQPVTPRGGGTP